MVQKNLLIGIDVGGTNTDSVLLNPSQFEDENRGVLSYYKTATTADVSDGISDSIKKLFDRTKDVSQNEVLAISIGTTHFINAVIEQDRARLEKVAVLRLCGPYSSGSYPFSDFPEGLTNIIKSYVAYVDGGNRVDGNEIRPLDEEAIISHAKIIKKMNIKSVAIVGIFSIMDKSHEVRAAQLIRDIIPDANIVASHEVSGIGFLSRENAAILNASIMAFASKIINSFIYSIRKLGFHCPILLTQNDGTVLTVNDGLKTPIRTFSSGATNSMRGAAFLCSKDKDIAGKSIMVVDIGGTTTDVGLLLPSGFPRQASSHSTVGGVRMNFSMPHVESIGLGGGSIVREFEGKLSIGPDSVGSDILNKSLVFGGSISTATDVTIALGHESGDKMYMIGSPAYVTDVFSQEYKKLFVDELKKKLENVIDRMRTSPEPIPVLLVGGGSFISPLELAGASKVIRPPFFQVANAIGAAMGKLSSVIQKIEIIQSSDDKDVVIERLTKEVTKELVAKGALKSSIKVLNVAYDPVPYVDKTYMFEIKVVGDVDYDKVRATFDGLENTREYSTSLKQPKSAAIIKNSAISNEVKDEAETFDYEKYVPHINEQREWIISETDLDYIRIGTYILGCGGGGTPYPIYLEMRNMLREGALIKVISLFDAHRYTSGDGKFITVGFAGSPTVAEEQLTGNELVDASEALFDYIKESADGVFPLEIGGGNGFKGLYCGSSTKLNLPVIDADLMGRAYPTHSQILPCALSDKMYLSLTSVSDGNGNKFLITGSQKDEYVEKMMRAALAEIGAHVGVVNVPMTLEELKSMTVHHSLSTAWRIGRAVKICQQRFEIDQMPQYILKSLGNEDVGRKIFAGKIIGVEKRLFKGHVYGEVIIESENRDKLSIPFKNENIVAKVQKYGTKEWKVICSVPDLISVCYADSGEAIGTPEYRYGVMVFVLALAPSELWTSSEKALNIGGPKAFGPAFEDIEYKPVGKHSKPLSVIDEYFLSE